jgi:hypothetical protein
MQARVVASVINVLAPPPQLRQCLQLGATHSPNTSMMMGNAVMHDYLPPRRKNMESVEDAQSV